VDHDTSKGRFYKDSPSGAMLGGLQSEEAGHVATMIEELEALVGAAYDASTCGYDILLTVTTMTSKERPCHQELLSSLNCFAVGLVGDHHYSISSTLTVGVDRVSEPYEARVVIVGTVNALL
jgi:hypothetical protein